LNTVSRGGCQFPRLVSSPLAVSRCASKSEGLGSSPLLSPGAVSITRQQSSEKSPLNEWRHHPGRGSFQRPLLPLSQGPSSFFDTCSPLRYNDRPRFCSSHPPLLEMADQGSPWLTGPIGRGRLGLETIA